MASSNGPQRCRRHDPALLIAPPPSPWAHWFYTFCDWHLIYRCTVCGAVGRKNAAGRVRWYAAGSRTENNLLGRVAGYQPQPRPPEPLKAGGVFGKLWKLLWEMDKAWEEGRAYHPPDPSVEEDSISR
jgi:hypothetical protein